MTIRTWPNAFRRQAQVPGSADLSATAGSRVPRISKARRPARAAASIRWIGSLAPSQYTSRCKPGGGTRPALMAGPGMVVGRPQSRAVTIAERTPVPTRSPLADNGGESDKQRLAKRAQAR
jgi:hypothetical protein